jgi:hypothetical protein
MACKWSLLLQQTPAVYSDWCRRLKHSATALGNQFVMMLHCKFLPIQIQLSVYDDTLRNSLAMDELNTPSPNTGSTLEHIDNDGMTRNLDQNSLTTTNGEIGQHHTLLKRGNANLHSDIQSDKS